jgi:hypothetical protein
MVRKEKRKKKGRRERREEEGKGSYIFEVLESDWVLLSREE